MYYKKNKDTPMTPANLVEIYCIFDEFCKVFEPELKKHIIANPEKRHRNRPCRVSDAEIMTILVLFHTSHFRDLKTFSSENSSQIEVTSVKVSLKNFSLTTSILSPK